MKLPKYLFAILTMLVTVLMACQTMDEGPRPDAAAFTIIETSDVHAAFFPYNFKNGQTMPTSIANLVTLLAQERAKGEVLLLDNGDNLQGQPIIYYYNFINTSAPSPMAQIYNELKFDVVGFGNHDVETGHAVYDKVNRELAVGFTCANLVRKSDDQPYFKPYSVVRRAGLKIVILGLIEPGFVRNFPEVLYEGLKVQGMVEAARKWMPIIQEKEKPDMVVGLFHAGVDYTFGGFTKEDPMTPNASQLVAEQVEGFDLILVGHDHQGWDGQGWDPVNKQKIDVRSPSGRIVPIFGSLDDVRKVPVIRIEAKRNSSGRYDFSIKGSLVDMSTYAPDAAFVAKYEAVAQEAKNWLNKEIAVMRGSINTRDSMFGDSAFVDLIHNLQLQLTMDPALGLKPAQISFAAPLSSDAVLPSRPDGKITVADMFTLYRYENWLYTMSLTGAQIDGYLEDSYANWFDQLSGPNGNLINFSRTPQGEIVRDNRTNMPKTKVPFYNYDSAQGIDYVVDVSRPAGDRVTILRLSNGEPFDLNKTYTVAINSFRAMGGGGIISRGAKIPPAELIAMKHVTSATKKDLRFYLTEWLEKNKGNPITPRADNNWRIEPAAWASAAAARDRALLYP